MLYETAGDGFLDAHVAGLRILYATRRNTMLEALSEYFPPEATWSQPGGGLFSMVTLPQEIDTGRLLAKALQQQVAFILGKELFVGTAGTNTMRLNFSVCAPERIAEGIYRLGRVVKAALAGRD